MYSEIVRDHAINPRNRGEIENADRQGNAAYRRCGDKLTMYFKLQGDVITQASFTARACGPVIATASLVTTLVTGQTVDQALSLGAFDINQALGGLPASKRHAILLVLQCLHEALGPSPNQS